MLRHYTNNYKENLLEYLTNSNFDLMIMIMMESQLISWFIMIHLWGELMSSPSLTANHWTVVYIIHAETDVHEPKSNLRARNNRKLTVIILPKEICL